MNEDKFRKKVEQELRKFDKKQVVDFAWRCGVRALPFLGSKGSFDFWNKKDRKKHIYAVFYALDYRVPTDALFVSDAAANAAKAAANATANATANAVAVSAANAAKAAYFANAANATAYATANAAANAATIAAAKNNINLEPVIFQDLNAIQNRREGTQPQPTDFYGEVWSNFQKALEAEGCAYWGLLYKSIFDDGLKLEPEALKMRINVPKEIRQQGAAAVASYLEALEKKGAKRLNEARIIILGDKGAGKTCIARRLIDPEAPMTTDAESTAGVNTMLWKLEHENINVGIWDFAGHTVTHAVHQFFLSERCLYLMVYDGRTEERNRLEYWLDHMKNYGGDSKAMILVNQRDRHSVDIKINFLKEKYPIAGVYTFSIKDDKTKLESFRNEVAGYIKNNPSWENQVIPSNYYQVKDELENLFAKGEKDKGQEHITKDEFNKIAERYEVENKEDLLKALHSLGVSLWYKDMEAFDTLVLNPEWISHGVYKIINWVNEAKKYSLTLDDFTTVFAEDAKRYPKDKHEFLFKLMKHYELAYETKAGKDLIIPHLLKEDRLATLPDFPVGKSLMLQYKAEQPLPPNTISRFIVRHNQEIKQEKQHYLVWRYGVVLKDNNGSLALVREEDRSISVSVKGKDKTNYISVLRATLNDIFNSYKSDKPELQYRIERFGEIPVELEEKDPLWLADRKIINHYQREKPYYDDATDQDISMAGVVNNYKIDADTFILGGQGHKVIKNTFNFRDCTIGLQGNLNELAQLLTEGGNKKEAEELGNIAKVLEQAEQSKSKEELKKKGLVNRLGRLLKDLENEDSKLHKTVKGIRNGISIAQDIAKGYNDIAQWAGLPQVPEPFLKK